MSDKKCVNIAVLTVSDTRTDADDKSGKVLVDRIKDAGHHLVEKKIIKDEKDLIDSTISLFTSRIISPVLNLLSSTNFLDQLFSLFRRILI